MHDIDLSQFDALRPLVALWSAKLEVARDHKAEKFGNYARVVADYYIGPHTFIYSKDPKSTGAVGFAYGDSEEGDIKPPVFQMTFNKVAELVQLFGPLLYARNPIRIVQPRKDWRPPDILLQPQQPPQPPPGQPQGDLSAYMQSLQGSQQVQQQLDLSDAHHQARASLLERYLNYTPNELNLREEFRLAIDEGLVKGRSCLWTEMHTPAGTPYRLIGTFFDSVDHFYVDPDVEQMKDAKWIARKCWKPIWEVEREHNLPPGALRHKGLAESSEAKAYANSTADGETARKQGRTADLICYYRIWSKMGLGGRLRSASVLSGISKVGELGETFGDYVYLEVSPDITFPLNVPPDLAEVFFGADGEQNLTLAMQAEQELANPTPVPPDPALVQMVQGLQQLRQAMSWPIPYYKDGTWPVTCLDFHPRFDCSWPMSHLRPALGEQTFLDWAYSFLAGHIRNACRTFVAVMKGAAEEIKTAIIEGRDMSIIPVDSINKNINEVVQFLQSPRVNADIFPIVEAVERNFEKRTGLSEMIYGQTSTQSRSAIDSQVKAGALQIRPDDMAERVEHCATMVARKEGIAARLFISGQDIAPILGEFAAQFWDKYVLSQDVDQVVREFEYRIEAGTAKKPNKERDIANTQESLQVVLPLLSQWAQMNPENVEALNALLKAWAKARDIDIADFLIKPPPQQPPGPQPGQPQQQQQAPQLAAQPTNGQPLMPAQ